MKNTNKWVEGYSGSGPLPGQAVDRHLKTFGHLPISLLCDEKGTCQKAQPLIDQAITQTQQDTLEMMEVIMDMASAGREDCGDCNDIFNYLEKQTIKKKMGEGK